MGEKSDTTRNKDYNRAAPYERSASDPFKAARGSIHDPSISRTRLTDAHLESFLLDTKGLSQKNATRIMRAIRIIQSLWGIYEPSEENAVLLKQAMRKKGRSPNTIRLYLWAMRYWAQADGADINFRVVQLPKPEKTIPRILDFKLVAKIINDSYRLSYRDRCIMMVFSISACRLGELAAINVADIDHVKRMILLHDTKTGKEKTAPIPSAYYPLLKKYLSLRSKWLTDNGKQSEALFISSRTGQRITEDGVRQVLYRIGIAYGIDQPPEKGIRHKRQLHPHAMRHTGTTKLMEHIGNPEEVMRITGHATSQMLDWYSHARDEVISKKMEGFKY
jgi:integrase/recombinase XerC